MCIACASMCHREEGLYIRLPSESNGPNLLYEPLKGFIVNLACSPWKCFGSYKPGHMGIMTHSESVQPLQSVKLVYQPCSRSRAALEPWWNRWSLRIIRLCYSLFLLTLIVCFTLGLKQLVATLMLKIVTTKTWMLLNLWQVFWALWTPCYTCWVWHVLTLVYFHYLDKNPGWVTDGHGNDNFPGEY